MYFCFYYLFWEISKMRQYIFLLSVCVCICEHVYLHVYPCSLIFYNFQKLSLTLSFQSSTGCFLYAITIYFWGPFWSFSLIVSCQYYPDSKKYIKKMFNTISSRKCKLKQQWNTTNHLLEWLDSRTPIPPNAGEDVEQQNSQLLAEMQNGGCLDGSLG